MPRARRVHAPGAAIHITARTQEKHKWFDEDMRSDIVDIIVEGITAFGHWLLAYAIMPNHFHILLKQSNSPLGWAMQRVMQRIYRRVKRAREIDGHVFSRQYWSEPCEDANHIRSTIVYSHLNPCPHLFKRPEDCPWTSHTKYLDPTVIDPGIINGILLFGSTTSDLAHARANYLQAIRETERRRLLQIPGDIFVPGSSRLQLSRWPHGDNHWTTHFSPPPAVIAHSGVDIGDATAALLRGLGAGCDVYTLRSAGRSRAIAPVRRNVIAGLASRGHPQCHIARYLRVSEALVSQIVTDMRVKVVRKD